jgi:hypothetical protein
MSLQATDDGCGVKGGGTSGARAMSVPPRSYRYKGGRWSFFGHDFIAVCLDDLVNALDGEHKGQHKGVLKLGARVVELGQHVGRATEQRRQCVGHTGGRRVNGLQGDGRLVGDEKVLDWHVARKLDDEAMLAYTGRRLVESILVRATTSLLFGFFGYVTTHLCRL